MTGLLIRFELRGHLEQWAGDCDLVRLRGRSGKNYQQRTGVQIATMPCLIAKRTNSAVVWMPNDSIIWYLWNSTVREEMPRSMAICFAELPSARSCRISRWRGGDVSLAFEGGADRGNEFGGGGVFEHVAGGAGLERTASVRDFLVHGEEDDFDAGVVLLEWREGVDAVEVRHTNVGDDDVGAEFFRGLDQGAPGFHDADEFKQDAEEALQALGDHAMIVGQKDPWLAQAAHTRTADAQRQ
jgi:hypothetical protein